MIGMDRHTGRAISGEAHLMQSVVDILTTRIGSRVMRRDYGSEGPALIDQPGTDETILLKFVASAEALDRWEPRVELAGFQLLSVAPDGVANISVDLRDRRNGQPFGVEVSV